MIEKLQSALKDSLKARDRLRSDVIRAVISEIKYLEIEKQKEPLPEEDCLAIVQREVKKRNEELEFNKKAGRPELIEATEKEILVLNEFLPEKLPAERIEKELVAFKQQNPAASMGLAMKFLKDSYAGQYDAKSASEVAKKIFG